jgi:hypothetical protein
LVNSFLDRMDNTKHLDDAFVPFLEEHGFQVLPFGQTILFEGSPLLASFKKLLVRDYSFAKFGAGFMMKFAPDYICIHQNGTSEPFFLDTKASVIPIIFDRGPHFQKLQLGAQEAGCAPLTRCDVGEIEREAWDVYTKYFPPARLAICFAAPYNPRLLAMEWCSKIKTFFRFAEDRNEVAGGSGTPHVNIHLGKMRTPDKFLAQDFGVVVDEEAYAALVDVVKKWRVQKPKGTVSWSQFVTALRRISAEGCPWIQGQMPDEQHEKYFGDGPLFKK